MNEQMLQLINLANVKMGAVGLTNFWSFFQTNVKYVIFAGTVYFAIQEWKAKAIGKLIMTIVIGAILFTVTLNPETALKPLGQKILEVLGV